MNAKDYIVCSNNKAVLLRYLEILKDKGVIEEDDYYNYKNYYNIYSEKYLFHTHLNTALWEYLEILDNDGVIEDYAKEHAVEQYYDSRKGPCFSYDITAKDIISWIDEDFENKPDEDDFDNYDDYEYAIERFYNEVYAGIYDAKVFLRNRIEYLPVDLQNNGATFTVVDKDTGATLIIPATSKYFDYFEDIVYEYIYKRVESVFKEVSEKYPFIGKF